MMKVNVTKLQIVPSIMLAQEFGAHTGTLQSMQPHTSGETILPSGGSSSMELMHFSWPLFWLSPRGGLCLSTEEFYVSMSLLKKELS